MVTIPHPLVAEVEQHRRAVRGGRCAALDRIIRGRKIARALRRDAHAPVAAGAAALAVALDLLVLAPQVGP